MLLSGRQIISRRLLNGLRDVTSQQQPCGVDLTLRRISEWTSAAQIDFDNSNRRAASVRPTPHQQEGTRLTCGTYLVDFDETIKVPKDCAALIYGRSSLWRSGATLTAGVIDAGYEGALGALLQVTNPHGIVLLPNAKLGQVVFQRMSEVVDGYSGIYQFAKDTAGHNGERSR